MSSVFLLLFRSSISLDNGIYTHTIEFLKTICARVLLYSIFVKRKEEKKTEIRTVNLRLKINKCVESVNATWNAHAVYTRIYTREAAMTTIILNNRLFNYVCVCTSLHLKCVFIVLHCFTMLLFFGLVYADYRFFVLINAHVKNVIQ